MSRYRAVEKGAYFSEILFLTSLTQAKAWKIEGDSKMSSFFQSCSNAEMKNEMETVWSEELSDSI